VLFCVIYLFICHCLKNSRTEHHYIKNFQRKPFIRKTIVCVNKNVKSIPITLSLIAKTCSFKLMICCENRRYFWTIQEKESVISPGNGPHPTVKVGCHWHWTCLCHLLMMRYTKKLRKNNKHLKIKTSTIWRTYTTCSLRKMKIFKKAIDHIIMKFSLCCSNLLN
jgi:hypothetical protein